MVFPMDVPDIYLYFLVNGTVDAPQHLQREKRWSFLHTEQISLIVDIFDLGQSYMGTLIL